MSAINHPPHYTQGVFEAIEEWKLGFNLGNTVKYIVRAEHKNAPVEDLKKAHWYLSREIANREARELRAKRSGAAMKANKTRKARKLTVAKGGETK